MLKGKLWIFIVIIMAVLPAILGQITVCTSDGHCINNKCCMDDGTCSIFDAASLPGGHSCSDDCECLSDDCTESLCVCTSDGHCINNKCCMDDGTCSIFDADSLPGGRSCSDDCECLSDDCTESLCVCTSDDHCINNKCCMDDGTCSIFDAASLPGGHSCNDDCECLSDDCTESLCADDTLSSPSSIPTPTPVCPRGSDICNDPHLKGLRGQHIDVVGIDGGWYCLVKDSEIDLHVNVRFTAPLPTEFPRRQLITGIALLSNGHSLVIEAEHPYDTFTSGCPDNILPCLIDGGLRITVDENGVDHFLHPNRDTTVFDDITLSASNLPVECRQFGGEMIWARMYEEMLQGQRKLQAESFEDWVLRFDTMAAHDWCTKYIAERGLDHVQSNHGVFKITSPTVVIRLNVGVNHQGEGDQDWDGRILPNLDFWQMDVGFEGLAADHVEITGILGETAHPVQDEEGHEVMTGDDALRRTVEDYRVSGPLGTSFALL